MSDDPRTNLTKYDVTDLIQFVPQGDGSLRIEPRSQSQDALHDQIVRVLTLATIHGEYDAADWISRRYFGERDAPNQRQVPTGDGDAFQPTGTSKDCGGAQVVGDAPDTDDFPSSFTIELPDGTEILPDPPGFALTLSYEGAEQVYKTLGELLGRGRVRGGCIG